MGTILVLLSFPFLFMPAIGLRITCVPYNTTIQPPDFHPIASVTQLPINSSAPIRSIHETECEKQGESVMLIYYLVFAVLYNFGWATIQINQLAMIPEITSDAHDRMTLTSNRNVATVMSDLSTYAIFLLFVKTGNSIKLSDL